MDNIEKLLNKLHKVKRTGHQQWVACCPAHDDKSPSLSIKKGNNGITLLHCFAGCGASHILSMVGLELSDLYEDDGRSSLMRYYKSLDNKRDKARQDKRALDIADFTLDAAKAMRAEGKRLTPEHLKQEREAFLKMRELNQ